MSPPSPCLFEIISFVFLYIPDAFGALTLKNIYTQHTLSVQCRQNNKLKKIYLSNRIHFSFFLSICSNEISQFVPPNETLNENKSNLSWNTSTLTKWPYFNIMQINAILTFDIGDRAQTIGKLFLFILTVCCIWTVIDDEHFMHPLVF